MRFQSLTDAMDVAPLQFFGCGPQGPRDPASDYGRIDTEFLTFDVSNGQILCSVTADGVMRDAGSVTALRRVAGSAEFRGAYAGKDMIGSGPWAFSLQIGEGQPTVLHDLPDIDAALVGGVFPIFTYQTGGLTVRQLIFAPINPAAPHLSPRAMIAAFAIRNDSSAAVRGRLQGPADEAVCFGEAPATFDLSPGEACEIAFALPLGRDSGERTAAAAAVCLQPALAWLSQTWAHHAQRLGDLTIPGQPFYAESLVRAGELARQSVLHLSDGCFAAGMWGSAFRGTDAWETQHIWIKDVYHAMLPMGMFAPELCLGAARWFLEYGMTDEPFGRGLKRLGADAAAVTHSLCNAMAPFQLAGEYYRCTGDAESLREHPELLAEAEARFDAVLASRQDPEVFLFPAMYISDGDARGDWHTGSNLVVWDAMMKMARIAREVFDRGDLAERWDGAAAKIKEAILAHCIAAGPEGPRFFEGVNRDGTVIHGHDGEETDTTLMPFYGFCEADDPALLSHARRALSAENPFYWPQMDGVWWVDEGSESMDSGGSGVRRFGATFPAWTTALAGAADEAQLLEQLERIRRLTDLDGSIWWWPYREGDSDLSIPRRDPAVMKCAWAAGVYVCLFVQNVLGLRADRPARTVSFRPFCPWPQFQWNACRLGENIFDVTYHRTDTEIIATLTNRNTEPYEAVIELMLPTGAVPSASQTRGRYGRPTARQTETVGPGQSTSLRASR